MAQLLRRRIALGGFAPGAKLPTERELAESLGVSRNTMREAIRMLARENIVATTLGRGGGTRVIGYGTAIPADESSQAAAEFHRFIDDRMEYRRLIEPGAAAFAARRGTEAERNVLTSLLARDVPDLIAYHQADTEFHLAIAAASHNPVLQEAIAGGRADLFMGGNALWLQADWHQLYGDRTPLGDVFRAEHTNIAEAIVAGDATAAAQFMCAHLDEAKSQFMQLIADPGSHE